MFKVIRKADILLFILLVCLGLAITWLSFAHSNTGQKVRVTVDGELYGTYSLEEDRTVEISRNNHINKITIKDGQVQMSASSCKNQICVKEGSVSKTNQSILCLPNKVMVEITGEEADFDAISN